MGKKEGRRPVRRTATPNELQQFYRHTNFIAVLLLIYTVLLLLTTSKIIEHLGEIEEERALYFTGKAVGEVAITISSPAPSTNGSNAPGRDHGIPRSAGSFDVEFLPKSFELELIGGEALERPLRITNIGDLSLEFILTSTLEDIITINQDSKRLAPLESHSFYLSFLADEPGFYTGYIVAQAYGVLGYIPVILTVSSEHFIGEVSLKIPDYFLYLVPGQEFVATVELDGFSENIIDLVYVLKNLENEEMFRVVQTTTLHESLRLDKTLTLPEDVEEGTYILGVEARSGGLSTAASSLLVVDKSRAVQLEQPLDTRSAEKITLAQLVMLFALLLVSLIFSIAIYMRELNKRKPLLKD